MINRCLEFDVRPDITVMVDLALKLNYLSELTEFLSERRTKKEKTMFYFTLSESHASASHGLARSI